MKMSDRVSYLVLFIPWFILFFAFTFGLALFNMFISLTDWHGIFPSFNLVGLKNYLDLPSMSGFLATLKNVGLLFGMGLPFAVFFATLLATLYLEFLFTRAVAGLLLLLINSALHGAFVVRAPVEPVFACICYLVGITAMFLIAVPYRFRDAIEKARDIPAWRRGLAGTTGALSLFFLLYAFAG